MAAKRQPFRWSGRMQVNVGHPLIDEYLQFLTARARPNTRLAVVFDLQVFFSVVDKTPVRITSADVMAFIREQPTASQTVVRIDGSAGLSPRTIRRRLSSVSGLYAYLLARGDTSVVRNPVPQGLTTRREGERRRRRRWFGQRSTPPHRRCHHHVAYVSQLGVSMRPSTAKAVETDLRIFARFLIDHDPALAAVADIERSHIEAFKLWQWTQPGTSGRLKPATFRRRLGQLRTFFLPITEWGWDDAPARVPIFFGDVPKRDEPLPRFLDDARFTKFMRALADEPVIRRRVAIEVLARTGMRVGELCGLEADAVTLIGDAHGCGSRSASSTTTATCPYTPISSSSSLSTGEATEHMTTAGCCRASRARSTATPSSAGSPPSPAGPASGMSIPTSCATRSPPRPSTEACRSRPSPPSSGTARWT